MHSQILYGAVLTAAGIGGIWYGRWLRRWGKRTTGSIVDVECQYDPTPDNGGTTYRAVLQFTTAHGALVRAVCRQGISVRPVIGKQVAVLYDPDNPHFAKIDTVWGRGRWIAGVALGFGVYLIVTYFVHVR